MSRIKNLFKKLKNERKKAFIPYIVAGDGGLDFSLTVMTELVQNGADIIELGVPFSDPMADGSIISYAHKRALSNNTKLINVLNLIKKFRTINQHTPIILMGYLNPLESMGYQKFANLSGDAGVDGVLMVDMPPEESSQLQKYLQEKQIDIIFLITLTSTKKRIQKICNKASGFIYFVSIKGITGEKISDEIAIEEKIKQIKKTTALPIAIGFGIKNANDAKNMAQYADAVVVGSSLVKFFDTTDQQKILQQIRKLSMQIREAT
ncbi:MAG: tryptophan synthase subunit alpha [Gammaproteobacteria bacterium]|nr:MAG: tryptophan synthase subunit alpha [Gammaproteobacteria bacterium]